MSAFYAVLHWGLLFASIGATIVHVLLWHGKTIYHQFKRACKFSLSLSLSLCVSLKPNLLCSSLGLSLKTCVKFFFHVPISNSLDPDLNSSVYIFSVFFSFFRSWVGVRKYIQKTGQFLKCYITHEEKPEGGKKKKKKQ
jgi:hypothetical protein